MATGVKNLIPGWHMYDFFSIPVVHIDNREQFLLTFLYIFLDFRQRGGGASYLIPPLSYPPSVVVKLGLKSINLHNMLVLWTGWGWGEVMEQPGKSAKHILQKIRETLKSVRAIFHLSSRCRSIPGEYMWNLQNYKYDSGRTHPGIDKIQQCVRSLSTR